MPRKPQEAPGPSKPPRKGRKAPEPPVEPQEGVSPPPKRRKRALSAQRQAFVARYLESFNASKAAREAGYSKKTAGAQGYFLLKSADVREAIRSSMARQGMDPAEAAARMAAQARGLAPTKIRMTGKGKDRLVMKEYDMGGALRDVARVLGMGGDDGGRPPELRVGVVILPALRPPGEVVDVEVLEDGSYGVAPKPNGRGRIALTARSAGNGRESEG